MGCFRLIANRYLTSGVSQRKMRRNLAKWRIIKCTQKSNVQYCIRKIAINNILSLENLSEVPACQNLGVPKTRTFYVCTLPFDLVLQSRDHAT